MTSKADLLNQLSVLQRKEEELAGMIVAIDSAFQELGYKVDNSVDVTKKSIPIQTGIRIKGELSFRGKEKAEEYFDEIDADKDCLLNFEDFRAIRAFRNPLGYVNAPEVQSSEAWQMYMAGRCLPPTESGGISKAQYVRYRAMIEQQQPLTPELEYLKLAYLPPRQKDWQRLNALLKEEMDFRASRLPPGAYAAMVAEAAIVRARSAQGSKSARGKSANTGAAVLPAPVSADLQDETFTIEDLSYILSNAKLGVVLSKPEIALLLLDRLRKVRTLEQLLSKYSKRNLSLQDFPFSLVPGTGQLALRFDETAMRIVSDDIKSVQRKDIAPWIMALPMLFDPKELYRRGIELKNRFVRGIRQLESITRHMFHFAAHLNDRLAFRDFPPSNRLPKTLQEVSTIKLGLNIGDEGRRDGGISGSFKMIKLDTPSGYFKQLKLPTDTGTMLMLDLLFHTDTSQEEGHRCAMAVKQFLGHHLEKELRCNKAFSGMVVNTALNESDDAKVLRIIFTYKRIVSLDGWLEHMLLPYGVNDFFSVLVGEFRSNFDLSEVTANKVNSLNETFAASFDLTVGMRRNLVILLLERLLMVVSAGVTPAQVNEKSLEETQQAKKKTTTATSAAAIAQEEGNRRVERWRYVSPFFASIAACTAFLLHSLRCMKSCAMRFRYSSISDCLYKLSVLYPAQRQHFQRGWTHQAGFIREKFLQFRSNYLTQFSELHLRLKKFLEKKKADDDARRIRELMVQQSDGLTAGQAAAKAEKAATVEKLKRLGIDASGSELFHEDAADPAEYLRSLSDEIDKQDVQNLIALESLHKHVIGLHSCELVTGKAKVSVIISGLDIFEILPNLPNMLNVQIANSLKPKSRK